VAFGCAGYLFGAAIEAYLGRVEHDEALVFVVVVVTGAGAWLARRRRERGMKPPGST
jgi:hypothetical protein